MTLRIKFVIVVTKDVLRNPAPTTNIPTMITALALPKLESALAGPIHLNKISSAIEVSAVTPMGYLFHANMTIIYRKIAMQKTICNVIG